MVTETRKEAGCIRYDLIKIDSNPNEYYLLEEFSNQETLGAHRETEHYKKYAPLLVGSGEAVFSVGKQVLWIYNKIKMKRFEIY